MSLGKKQTNSKTKEKLDYDFDYDGELEIYKSIGSSKGSKKNELILMTYMDWKEYVEKNYKEKYCNLYRNRQNFSRYLLKKKREAKRTVNLVCNLLIPIEIGAITIFCNVNNAIDNFYEMIGFVVPLLGVVILIVIKKISDAEKEGYFVDDLWEILFEEK